MSAAGNASGTVLLMRHAKSSWDDAGLDDHDRPLNKRGLRDAPRMGRLLVANGLVPERIITSSAQRARRTAELVAVECGSPEVTVDERLYMADQDDWLTVLTTLPPGSPLLLIGHNPGLEELVSMISGDYVSMPTAAIARIHCPKDSPRSWHLDAVWRPKELD